MEGGADAKGWIAKGEKQLSEDERNWWKDQDAQQGKEYRGDDEVLRKIAENDLYHGRTPTPQAAEIIGRDSIHDAAMGQRGANDAREAANELAMGRSSSALNGFMDDKIRANEDVAGSNRELAGRNQHLDAIQMLQGAASGDAPSAAAYQTRMDMNGMAGQAAGEAGMARGLGALTGVGIGGASGVAGAAAQAGMAGGMARSGEIDEARGMYGSNAGMMRGQDMMRLDIGNKMSQGNASRLDNWKVGNANLLAAQGRQGAGMRGIDDAWTDRANDPIYRQFSNDQETASIAAGNSRSDAAAAKASEKSQRMENAQQAQGYYNAGVTAMGPIAGAAMGGSGGGGMGGSTVNSSTRKYY